MSNVYFFTGFPGFISTQLMKEIINSKRDEIARFYLLVLPNMRTKANETLQQIIRDEQIEEELFSLIIGDITVENLAIEPTLNKMLRESVTHVFHLAAIYDLAVPETLANKVNVDGTNQVNRWVRTVQTLKRYVYFSTAYVAGDREGRIYETDLQSGQAFKNHYERTKYEAEVLVNELKKDVPVTIIRPGIVVGHSKTGETIKFDGPYFILNFIERLKWLPFFPYLGKGLAEGNFVPIDYITKATIYLAHVDKGIDKTYHLADPNPYRAKDIYRYMVEEHLGKRVMGYIPLICAKILLSLPSARRWLGVEKEALEYFECQSEYDCSIAVQDLEGSGVSCPDFRNVLKTMVAYYQDHKQDKDKHINIV